MEENTYKIHKSPYHNYLNNKFHFHLTRSPLSQDDGFSHLKVYSSGYYFLSTRGEKEKMPVEATFTAPAKTEAVQIHIDIRNSSNEQTEFAWPK
jgi:hypothetical protein